MTACLRAAEGASFAFRMDSSFSLTGWIWTTHPQLKELSLAIDQMGCRIGVDHYVWLRAC